MRKELQDLWDEAARSGERMAIGRLVACDDCGEDYTDSPATGGIIWGGKATCQTCCDQFPFDPEEDARERGVFFARPGEGESFGDFVRRLRGPEAYVSITTKLPA